MLASRLLIVWGMPPKVRKGIVSCGRLASTEPVPGSTAGGASPLFCSVLPAFAVRTPRPRRTPTAGGPIPPMSTELIGLHHRRLAMASPDAARRYRPVWWCCAAAALLIRRQRTRISRSPRAWAVKGTDRRLAGRQILLLRQAASIWGMWEGLILAVSIRRWSGCLPWTSDARAILPPIPPAGRHRGCGSAPSIPRPPRRSAPGRCRARPA